MKVCGFGFGFRFGLAHLSASHVYPATYRCAVGKAPLRQASKIGALLPCCTEASPPVINCVYVKSALFCSDERLRAERRGHSSRWGSGLVNQGKQRARALTATTGAQCRWMTTNCSMRKLRSMAASSRCQPERRAMRKSALSTEDSEASRCSAPRPRRLSTIILDLLASGSPIQQIHCRSGVPSSSTT